MSAPVQREKVESARTYLEDFARLSKPGEIRLPREDAADAFGHVRTLLADHAALKGHAEFLEGQNGGLQDLITAQTETIKSLSEALQFVMDNGYIEESENIARAALSNSLPNTGEQSQ